MSNNKPIGWYKGIVHLKDLPDNIWLDMKDDFRSDLICAIKKETRRIFILK
jgi:hypothetical protein